MKKALVLYSGGLDSRLVVRLLQDQGFQVEALYFGLPFGCGCCNISCNFNFTQTEGVKLTIMDCTKKPLLSEYLEVIKNPRFGTGSGINPCKDCKIFMFKKAKEYADKNKFDVIATGEVLGQRPMSQIRKAMTVIDAELGFEILRPLCAKRLQETSYEKSGLVDRSKLYNFTGRSRKGQLELAKKFDIKYPNPSGGCFLCEREPSRRIRKLLRNSLLTERTISLSTIGRHFIIDGVWFVVARDENECILLDNLEETFVGGRGKPSVYMSDQKGKQNAEKLAEVYSTGASEEQRAEFKKFKI
jgi:tRNA U34 2-thiouridine synthase MnmA/TrmU